MLQGKFAPAHTSLVAKPSADSPLVCKRKLHTIPCLNILFFRSPPTLTCRPGSFKRASASESRNIISCFFFFFFLGHNPCISLSLNSHEIIQCFHHNTVTINIFSNLPVNSHLHATGHAITKWSALVTIFVKQNPNWYCASKRCAAYCDKYTHTIVVCMNLSSR